MNIDILLFQSNRRDNCPIVNEAQLMMKAAEQQGHQVQIVNGDDFSLSFSKNGTEIINKDRVYDMPDGIISWVGMLNAISERAVILRELKYRDIPVINDYNSVVRTRDKLRTMQYLAKAELPVIKSVMVAEVDNLDSVLERIGNFPVVLKTTYGNDGKGVAIYESKRSLVSGIELLLDNKIPCESIIIQEFVEADNKDYRLFAVGGKVIAQMERQAPSGDFRANIDGGGTGSVVDLDPEVVKIAERAAQVVDLDIAGVDILIGPEGPKLCEINPRPGFKIADITGVDVATEIINMSVNKIQSGKTAYVPGADSDVL